MKVSVIIVTYFSEKYIRKCIESLLTSSYRDIEIIVVDNDSRDATPSILREYEGRIRSVFLSENRGFSAGCNAGAIHSSGEILFFLNPDAFVTPDCIEKMVSFLSSQPGKVIVGPLILNEDGSIQRSVFPFPGIFDIAIEAFFISYLLNLWKRPPSSLLQSPYFECEAMSGAALMIRKEHFYEIGGWDENLFWMEDVDLCYRNKIAGGKNFIVSSAVAYHSVSGSARNFPEKVIPNQILSKIKFFKKHKGLFVTLGVFFLLVCHCISRILILSLLSFAGEIFRKKLYGYIRAIRHLPGVLVSRGKVVT